MNALDRIIERQNNPEAIKEREDKIAFYKESVRKFFDKIDDWLYPYIERKELEVKRYSNRKLFEEGLGNYELDWMEIRLGNYSITLRPQGSLIVGAEGRIDMRCESNTVMFVYIDKRAWDVLELSQMVREKSLDQDKFEWKYVDPDMSGKYSPFKEDVFFNAIAYVINGSQD